MKACRARGSPITRSARSFCPGCGKADDSISRSMGFIWIGWRCLPASNSTRLEQQITIWKDSVEVLQAFPHVEPGSAVIIDEAQTVFRSMQKVEPGLLRWLETHRHYGVDILLMSQDFRQMSQGVTRLIEATVKFRKLAFVGSVEKVSGQGARESRRPRDHSGLRRDLFAGDLRLLFELCVGGDPGRETQPYRLQVGAGRDRHCRRAVCHWPHGLAALVVIEQHEGNFRQLE